MAEKEMRLARSGSGVFDSNGIAVVAITNSGASSRWVIKNTAVSSTSDDATQCQTYRNYVSSGTLIDSTKQGNGRSSDTVTELVSTETFIARWTGGTPGSTATVTITGADYQKGLASY